MLKNLIVFLPFIFTFSCISTSEVKVGDENYFPTVSGTNLHGEEKTFPECLVKDKTILVIAFQRWQQSLCDQWYVEIEKYLAQDKNSAYFEVPTISKMNAFTRWFIYNGMRGGIKDQVMRGQVITLHIDKEPFNKSLGIESEDTVHVYVVNKDGKILDSVSGEWTSEKWERLLSTLKETVNL